MRSTLPVQVSPCFLAVRVGFEPTEPVKVQRFSRPPDSTALAPHRSLIVPFPNYFLTLFLGSTPPWLALTHHRLEACILEKHFNGRQVCGICRLSIIWNVWVEGAYTLTAFCFAACSFRSRSFTRC